MSGITLLMRRFTCLHHVVSILGNESHSLTQFCQTTKHLLEHDDPTSFVNFVLCSRHQDHQVVIDPIQNRLDEEYGMSVLRDFDSLLGICKDIPIHTSLTLFPLAKKEDTLNTNIHLDYSFNIPGISYIGLIQENFHG